MPASADGYYDANGQWIAGTAGGYYDSRGRWVAGATMGHYDSNGRWMVGAASGHRDSAGVWMSADKPGYYDNRGRWHAGATSGYYDGQGRWIARPSGTNGTGSGMPREIRAREAWLERYIRSAGSEGNLSRMDTNRALRDLSSIRRSEQYMRRDRQGALSRRDQAMINMRLDRLSNRLGIASFEDDRRY